MLGGGFARTDLLGGGFARTDLLGGRFARTDLLGGRFARTDLLADGFARNFFKKILKKFFFDFFDSKFNFKGKKIFENF